MQPASPYRPVAPPPRGAAPAGPVPWALLGVAFLSSVVQVVFFFEAFDALNRQEPRQDAAQGYGAVSLFLGFVAGVAAAWAAYRVRAHIGAVAFPVAAATLGAALLATQFGATLGSFGILAWLIVELVVGVGAAGLLLAGGLMAWLSRHSRVAWGLAAGGLLFQAVPFLLTTLAMLLRLESLARQASRANEPPDVPAFGLLAAALALAVGVGLRRRFNP